MWMDCQRHSQAASADLCASSAGWSRRVEGHRPARDFSRIMIIDARSALLRSPGRGLGARVLKRLIRCTPVVR